jgi:hypothetical protein
MRSAIDRWPRPSGAIASPRTVFGAGEVSIADVATASYLIEARADRPVPVPPVIGDSFRDPDVIPIRLNVDTLNVPYTSWPGSTGPPGPVQKIAGIWR